MKLLRQSLFTFFVMTFVVVVVVVAEDDVDFYANYLARKEPKIFFDEKEVSVQVGRRIFVDVVLLEKLEYDAEVEIGFYDEDTVKNSSGGVLADIHSLRFEANYNRTTAQVKAVSITARKVGQVTLVLRSTSSELNSINSFNHTFVVVDVVHSANLKIFNNILGWTYMVFWGVSYYPQVFLNFKSWSVSGFSIDYGLLNILAYTSYDVVMCSMYWSPYIQAIYFREHPHSPIPVEIPDLASVIHNTALIALLALQCACLPDGGQRLSKMSWFALVVFFLAPLICLPIAFTGTMDWLSFIHVYSYIKIGISVVKYAPQAYLNWRRKSTAGYSSVNICLDFSGSTSLVLQLTLMAANRDDIWSMVGNPAKFGVGFASWIFTGIFVVQNFILYRNAGREECAPLISEEEQRGKKGYSSIQ